MSSAWHPDDSCVTRRHEKYLTAVSGDSGWFVIVVRAWNAVVGVSV